MKRIFLGLFLACLIAYAYAGPVTKSEAKALAETFFAVQNSLKSTKVGATEVYTSTCKGENTFYVFSFTGGGFVIIAADDDVNPIIGYSLTGTCQSNIDNPVVSRRFEWMSKKIYHQKSLKSKDAAVEQSWENLRKGKVLKSMAAGSKGPLLTTTWDQSPYYNALCPSHTPAGCVAVAMAQIMNYYKWPAKGNGWHSYIPSDNPSYGRQYANFGETAYDWTNMVNALTLENSAAEKKAVSTLIYHAGVSVDMNFGREGSGSSSATVMVAMTSYFKYNPSTINLYYYDSNDESAWTARIKAEIDAGRPVYYSGHDQEEGGHAFVCDGYNSSDYLHINWGWSGTYDGYFLPSALTPGTFSFTEYDAIITGITPGSASQNRSWTIQASGFSTSGMGIRSLAAVNNRIAWAVAYNGADTTKLSRDFTRTTDGGTTWNAGKISISSLTGMTSYATSMIAAVSDSIAWVPMYSSAGGGKLVKTSDAGTTWTVQTSAKFYAPKGFPNMVYFWDKNNGFCQGDPNGGYFEIYTTTDGGATWTRVSKSNIPSNLDEEYATVGFFCVYNDIVWFSTTKGRLYKSTDRGHTWAVYQTPLSESFEISFKNASTGIIQSRGASTVIKSYRSTDGGQNWTQITPTGNFYNNAFVYMPGTDTLISTGSNSVTPFMGVSYSTDNGNTFTDYADFYKSFQFLALGASPDGAVWAGSFNYSKYDGGMWHKGDLLLSGDFKINKTSALIKDSTVILTDLSLGSPETWVWDFGSGALPKTLTGQGPHKVKYTSVGDKNIMLTITKGNDQQIVVKKKAVNIYDPTGVDDIVQDGRVVLYPNPARTTIRLSGFETGSLSIYSTAGALVLSSDEVSAAQPIDISNLANGAYVIKIQTSEGKTLTKKLLIQ